jgi:hypothetical protein
MDGWMYGWMYGWYVCMCVALFDSSVHLNLEFLHLSTGQWGNRGPVSRVWIIFTDYWITGFLFQSNHTLKKTSPGSWYEHHRANPGNSTDPYLFSS